MNLYSAIGDDFRLGVFMGVPGAALGLQNLANDNYPVDARARERIVAQGLSWSTINNNIKKSAIRSMPMDVSGSNFKGADSVEAHALDCPNINLSPMSVVRSPMGYFTNATDVVFNERLSLYPGDSITVKTPEDFGTTVDETTVKYWTSKWAREGLADFVIASSTASGSLLLSSYVCPMAIALATNYHLGGQYYMTPLDYASMKFNYWRGSIEVRIDIIASAFHSCRLFACYSIGSAAVPPTLAVAMSCYGSYIDVNADSHSFVFRLPYESTLNALRVPNGVIRTGDNLLDFVTGTFSLWVVNELVAPAGVSTFVDANYWVRGGDDFELFALGNNNATWINVPISQDLKEDRPTPNPATDIPDEDHPNSKDPDDEEGFSIISETTSLLQ